MNTRTPGALLLIVALAACQSGPPQPAPLDARHDACSSCRMAVSEVRFASQVVAPGEMPHFFDDLGCLASFVKAGRAPAGAAAFVADHRTKEWVRADHATYTRRPGVATPMGSHLIAHASASSRDLDPAAEGGTPVPVEELFGPMFGTMGRER